MQNCSSCIIGKDQFSQKGEKFYNYTKKFFVCLNFKFQVMSQNSLRGGFDVLTKPQFPSLQVICVFHFNCVSMLVG